MIRKIYILTPSHLPYFITVTETNTPMFIRHSTPSNSKWDKKKNKKTPTQDYYWTNKKNLNIHLFAGINKWIYSVSYLERHLNINKQTPSVRQKHYQWRTHFFLLQESPIYTLYSYTLAAERYLSQPAMLKSQSVQKMFRPRTCTVTSLWLNVYILCSEQKNASQKPSVVVYNIGCQKGFI